MYNYVQLCTIMFFYNIIFFSQDELVVQNLTITNWNSLPFQDIIEDLVFKDGNISVTGLKTFQNGLTVIEDVATEAIGNKMFSDLIFINEKSQNISGPMHIKGNVEIERSLEINGTLNNYTMDEIKWLVTEDENGNFVINGDVQIKGKSIIERLNGAAYLNDIYLPTFFDSMVFKDGYMVLPQTFKFNDQVKFYRPKKSTHNF